MVNFDEFLKVDSGGAKCEVAASQVHHGKSERKVDVGGYKTYAKKQTPAAQSTRPC